TIATSAPMRSSAMARLAPTSPPPTMTTSWRPVPAGDVWACSLMAALCYRFRPGRLHEHDDPTRFRNRLRPRPRGAGRPDLRGRAVAPVAAPAEFLAGRGDRPVRRCVLRFARVGAGGADGGDAGLRPGPGRDHRRRVRHLPGRHQLLDGLRLHRAVDGARLRP